MPPMKRKKLGQTRQMELLQPQIKRKRTNLSCTRGKKIGYLKACGILVSFFGNSVVIYHPGWPCKASKGNSELLTRSLLDPFKVTKSKLMVSTLLA